MFIKHGFTLIELLIVLLIISITSTAILLSINRHQDTLKPFAETLLENLTFAQEKALLQAKTLGVLFKKDRYLLVKPQISKTRAIQWIPMQDQDFQPVSIPKEITFSLTFKHVLVADSRGMFPPFTITLRQQAACYRLTNRVNGRVLLQGGCA